MRPAQLTPETLTDAQKNSLLDRVSMRPAQLTPETVLVFSRLRSGWRRFNEAGAINAGNQDSCFEFQIEGACFNEAGAINAGNRHCLYHIEKKGKSWVNSSNTRDLMSCM